MKKRILALALSTVMVLGTVTGCGNTAANNAPANDTAVSDDASTTITAPESDVAMQYITVEDASGVLENEEYVFFDVRKADDYNISHIPGAVSHDMDAAKEGDFDAGVTTMQAAVDGLDKNIVVICYSGKKYAQATTNVLSALGYDMTKVYTLEGGFTAWSETYPDNVEIK